MPKEKRPLDVEALLMWLIEKLDTHIAGGDVSTVQLVSTLIPAVAMSAAAASDTPASESNSISVVLPSMSMSAGVV